MDELQATPSEAERVRRTQRAHVRATGDILQATLADLRGVNARPYGDRYLSLVITDLESAENWCERFLRETETSEPPSVQQVQYDAAVALARSLRVGDGLGIPEGPPDGP